MAKKAGVKPKYNYTSDEFLEEIKRSAKKGMTDKEIALSINLSPEEFSRKKTSIPQLSQALTRARAQINAVVRQKYLALGLGGVKTKTITRKKIELPDGEINKGEVIYEVETELAPNANILATWLFNHDDEWRQKTIDGKKLDVTSNGETVGTQLIFAETPLSEKDLMDIKRIQNGNDNSEENSTNTSL